jgi:glycosyltransferase involved in cell wall biosynthesis
MRIDLAFPVLPPTLDGIGDHTAFLASALAEQAHDVRILTAQSSATPVPGVHIVDAFSTASRQGVRALADAVAASPPDWFVLQYNPFSYGRWGLNLSLPPTLHEIRHRCPGTRVALMVHEPFVPVESWRFALFTTWQRWQLWALGRQADLVLFSIAPWVERFQRWFPQTPLCLLPVGSNIPVAPSNRPALREHLGIAPDTLVCGFFGSAHESRDLGLLRPALMRLREKGLDASVLYVGTAGTTIRSMLADVPFHDAGPLPADDVSRHMAAMDLFLAPFRDGVSTRRGSFMVGLQHGRPTVTTTGPDTDSDLHDAAGTAFLAAPQGDPSAFARQVEQLATDAETRWRIGQAGATLYSKTYDWPHVAVRLITTLSSIDSSSAPVSRRLGATPSGATS